MPNANYTAGRRVEYEIMDEWRKKGWEVIRASGSHGKFDVVAFGLDSHPVFIQAKRVSTEKQAERLEKSFRKSTVASVFFLQALVVKVKGTTKLRYTNVWGGLNGRR